MLGGHRDHREIELVGDLFDRLYPWTPATTRRGMFTGNDAPSKSSAQDVPEQLAAYRAVAR